MVIETARMIMAKKRTILMGIKLDDAGLFVLLNIKYCLRLVMPIFMCPSVFKNDHRITS